MQCPRCGTDNPPGITACIRCGLPAYPVQSPYTPQPGQQPLTPPLGRNPKADSAIAKLAAVMSAVAALMCLAYGIFAITARSGLYDDIAADAPSVSSSEARNSDTLNDVLLWVAVGLAVLAAALWVLSIVAARRGAGRWGLSGLLLVLLGAAAAMIGAVRVSGVESATEADDGATGYVLVGGGFVTMAVGHALGFMALRQPAQGRARAASYAEGPYGNQYAPYGNPPGGSRP